MPSIYDYMLQDPTQERMNAAADLLAGRRARATLGVMTGDPVLGRYGTSELERTQRQAELLAGAAAKRRQPGLMSLGNGMLYNPRTGETITSPEYQASQAEQRQHELNKARVSAEVNRDLFMQRQEYQDRLRQEGENRALVRTLEQEERRRQAQLAQEKRGVERAIAQEERAEERVLEREARTAVRMPESTHVKVADYAAQAGAADTLTGEFDALKKAGEDISEPVQDIPAAVSRRMGATGAAQLMERITKPENVRNFRAKLATFVDAYRHARFGSQLTGPEIQEFLRSNPLAYGLSDSEVRARINIIRDWYKGQEEALRAERVAPGREQMTVTAGPEGASVTERIERPEGVTDEEWSLYLQAQQGVP